MNASPLRCAACLSVGAAAVAIACGGPLVSSRSSRAWLSDMTERSKLNFVHRAGPTGSYWMPQAVGSGAALFDFDNDGRLDVYLLQNAPPGEHAMNRLFHQERDGTFRDVTAGSGLDVAGYGMGVAVGDVNNDGWPDVLVTQYRGVRLFLNRQNGTFVDVTAAAGLNNADWGTSATFLDYDRDGWLDLVVANYVVYNGAVCHYNDRAKEFCAPNHFEGGISRLYHNLGASTEETVPRFDDVTVPAGLDRKGSGLGVVVADVDGDRWPDIFVANDGMENFLWMNQRDGTFREEGAQRGVAYDATGNMAANMGIAVGDVNGDGLFDIFVTHESIEYHTAWLQGPPGTFQDRTGAIGLTRPKWRSTGFGTTFADFDQDGALDLVLANGHVAAEHHPRLKHAEPPGFWESYGDRNEVFANDGTGRFTDISDDNPEFSNPPSVWRALAVGDIDGDGALDLLVTRIGASARLYRNVAPNRGHWLRIRTILPQFGGRDAYGAEVTVRAGQRKWKRIVNPGYSYLASNAPDVHFGLGSVDRVDAISVVWPDGTEEQFPGGRVDRVLVLRQGIAQREPAGS
jgi:enediyne biosynthesis protein E4